MTSEPSQEPPQNQWRRMRALVRPDKCSGGAKCWVEHGSGYIQINGSAYFGCAECHAVPSADSPAFYREVTMLLAREAHDHR